MNVIPPSLKDGDLVAVVAPAGNIHDQKQYFSGCSILKEMGFQILPQESRWPGSGFLSDTDEARAQEFMVTWCHPEVKAVFALRGGYGSLRIVDQLDMKVIKKQPKFFIGFSDITILLHRIACRAHMICLHGPVLSSLSSSNRQSIDRLNDCLRGNWCSPIKEQVEVIRATPEVSGTLIGGNLSSLVSLIGTGGDSSFENTILFLEDVNESPYRLDRLLTQFCLSGKFNGVSGIILGDFSNGQLSSKKDQLRLHESVWHRVLELVKNPEIPIWGRFPTGHGRRNMALPVGAHCTMNSIETSLRFFAK